MDGTKASKKTRFEISESGHDGNNHTADAPQNEGTYARTYSETPASQHVCVSPYTLYMLLRTLLSLAARALSNGLLGAGATTMGGSLQEFSSYGVISWALAKFIQGVYKTFCAHLMPAYCTTRRRCARQEVVALAS